MQSDSFNIWVNGAIEQIMGLIASATADHSVAGLPECERPMLASAESIAKATKATQLWLGDHSSPSSNVEQTFTRLLNRFTFEASARTLDDGDMGGGYVEGLRLRLEALIADTNEYLSELRMLTVTQLPPI
jgi:hypothetical protein